MRLRDLLSASLACVLSAVAVAADDAAAPLHFRRVFVPQERIQDWPLANEKYLPLDAAEFERLATTKQTRTADSQSPPAAAITVARYEARLTGECLAGRCSAEVTLAGRGPAMLPFEPCTLAIGQATWENAPPVSIAVGNAEGDGAGKSTAADAVRPGREKVRLGLGGDGSLAVLVERPGRLNFEWSLAGRRDPGEALCFAGEIPPAAASELSVELPAGLTPAVDRGLLLGGEPAGKTTRRWLIAIGGGRRFRLRLLPAGQPSRRPPLALLRESRTYDCSLRGVELSVLWRIQAHNEPLQQVTALLDPELQLIAARFGDESISWSAAPAANQRTSRIVLTLPEPIRDAERTVRLTAICPLSADCVWRLPRIRAEGLFWQEGNLSLLLSEPLVAERIAPLGCGQTGAGQLSAPRIGESSQFQAFGPEATVEVSLARRRPTVHATIATAIELGGEEATARVGAAFNAANSTRFALEADVAPLWTIDALESTPSDAVADWTVEPKPDGGQLLAIRLAGGLSPAKSLQLAIAARRPFSPPTVKLGIGDLVPVRFHEVSSEKDLVAVSAAGTYALALSGDKGLQRRRADSLDAVEARLFSASPPDLLFERDARANRLQVSLAARRPKYSAAIDIDAALDGDQLCERCVIRCQPQTGRVDRLLVQFCPRRDAPPTWIVAGESDRQLSARKWSDEEQAAAGLPIRLETWEIALLRPQDAPFEITATRKVLLTNDSHEQATLTLAALPEAVSQRGALTIHSVRPDAVHIENCRLQPIAPPPPPPGQPQTARGAYRYDPVRDVASAGVSVSVRRRAETSRGVWAWNCGLESWHQSDGVSLYQATYDLQSSGEASLRLTMPPGVGRDDVRGVWIDQRPARWRLNAGRDQNQLAVELPATRKFPRLTICWTAVGPALGIAGSLDAPMLTLDAPVLAQSWTVWLPPGYAGLDAERFDPPPTDARLPWASDEPVAAPPTDTRGWMAWRTAATIDRPAAVRFVHGGAMLLCGALAFLLVAAAGSGRFADRPMFWQALAGGCVAAAILMPGAYAPPAIGGALGAVCCLVRRRMRRRKSAAVAPTSPTRPESTITAAVSLGAIVLAAMPALAAGVAVGIEFPATSSVDQPPTYSVLVPIDTDKKPSGGKVYLPEPFYKELYRRRAATTERPQGWLVLRAVYRGALTAEAAADRWRVDVLRAQYDLQVFERATRVRIPLRADDVNLLPNGVSVDGREIEPQWEPDDKALAFELAEPGEYRLEVLLRPTMRAADAPAGFDLAIPRVARSRLELSLPDDAPTVEIPTACGAVDVEKTPSRLVADLGPAERLTLRWRAGGAPAAAVDVEQLTWLKVRPGSVVIAARFKFHVVEGQIQQVRLAADPQLRLLPLSGDDQPTVQVGPERGQSRLITFHWPRPVTDQTTLEAAFLLSGAAGVGNFRLPRIELLDARPIKHWMAVSVDAALDREEQRRQRLEAVAISDFLDAWGATDGAEARPQTAYRLPSGEIDWTIATRPHEPGTTADQTLAVTYDADLAETAFEAQLSTTSGYVFQHQVAAPADLKIETVSLLAEGVERAVRWSRDADGVITILLDDAASGRQRLLLTGRLPIVAEKPLPLPRFQMERCQVRSSTVRLFSRPMVRLSVEGQRLPIEPPAIESLRPETAKFVEAFAWNGPTPPSVTVRVTPDRPVASPSPPAQRDSRPPPAPRSGAVRLADIVVTWLADGGQLCAAAFDLDANDADCCTLRLPAGCEPLRTSVDGMPVAAPAANARTWRVPLLLPRSFQRVEVLYRVRSEETAAGRSGRRVFESPTIENLPVRQTIWTAVGPARWTASNLAGAADVAAWRQELLRLVSADDALKSLMTDEPEAMPNGRRLWIRRVATVCAALQQELSAVDADTETAAAERAADAIARRTAELAAQLKTSDDLAPPPPAESPTEILRFLGDAARPVVRCAFEGQADSLTIDCRPPAYSSGWRRAAAAAVLAALLAAAVFARRFQRAACCQGAKTNNAPQAINAKPTT